MPPSAELTCLDLELELELVRVTELAALAASRWVGQGDVDGGVAAATAAARSLAGSLPLRGRVAVGEGHRGGFRVGEELGDGTGPVCDVAVAPLQGAVSAARGAPGALAAIAMSVGGGMLGAGAAEDMTIVVVGPEHRDVVDVDRTIAENVRAVAAAGRRPVSEVTVAVHGHREHATLVREVIEVGARLRCVTGAEVAAALCAARPDSDIDLLVGLTGLHGGVLTAAAVACLDGSIQARVPTHHATTRGDGPGGAHDGVRATMRTRDLVGENVFFGATGVTGGEEVGGVVRRAGLAVTHSVAMNSRTGTVRLVEGVHRADRLPDLIGFRPRR